MIKHILGTEEILQMKVVNLLWFRSEMDLGSETRGEILKIWLTWPKKRRGIYQDVKPQREMRCAGEAKLEKIKC